MSLFGALFTGVSALGAQSSSMSVISNNIANVNTVGYKSSSANFSTLVTGSGSSDGSSSGGVSEVTTSNVSSQGTLESTSSSTDLAISGNGFFVVGTNASGSASTSNNFYYTRAGSFSENADGYLVNTAGYVLYGWQLTNGALPTSTSDLSTLDAVNISYLGGNADPTTSVTLNANLDSSTAAAGTFTRDVTVYDSLGTAQTMEMVFTKGAANNQWTLEVKDSNGTDLLPTNTSHTPNDQTVDVTFNSSGAVSSISSSGASLGTTLSVAGSAGTGIDWGDGSTSQTISLNLGNLTQFNSSSSVTSLTQDGAALGLLTGVSVSDTGVVSATFSNGTTKDLYQLAVATFANEDGLQSVSGNAYSETTAAGNYNLRVAGDSGSGTVSSKSLEESNVDLATEFSNMIVTQRAYSAGTKVITTVDQMLQDLLQTT